MWTLLILSDKIVYLKIVISLSLCENIGWTRPVPSCDAKGIVIRDLRYGRRFERGIQRPFTINRSISEFSRPIFFAQCFIRSWLLPIPDAILHELRNLIDQIYHKTNLLISSSVTSKYAQWLYITKPVSSHNGQPLRGHPLVMSAKISDFLTPSLPCPQIHATSLTKVAYYVCFRRYPPPPSVRTS